MEKICIEKRLEGNSSKKSLARGIMGVFIFLSTPNFQIFYSDHTLKKSKTSCILKLSIKILAKKW